jgi:cardiolipin-specific phospholipase
MDPNETVLRLSIVSSFSFSFFLCWLIVFCLCVVYTISVLVSNSLEAERARLKQIRHKAKGRLNHVTRRSLSSTAKHKFDFHSTSLSDLVEYMYLGKILSPIMLLTQQMKASEARLLKFAGKFVGRNQDSTRTEISIFDTKIGSSSVLRKLRKDEEELSIHGVQVTSKLPSKSSTDTPLVILHGYMNASAYFYRNLMGLSSYFNSIYALDMLGWGLSSRPKFDLIDDSVETAEDFFCESLEQWRVAQKIDTMILAGHSMGGYLSVAYTERYPQHVERLILMSPVGVPDESPQGSNTPSFTWRFRLAISFFRQVFTYSSFGSFLRTLPAKRSKELISRYVAGRIPAISDAEEREAVADYLYLNSAMPGSGEHCLNRILNPTVFAKRPLLHRIPNLQIDQVSFLYGMNDWMDLSAGLAVQRVCEEQRLNGDKAAPSIDVYEVSNAGHLLVLENWKEFNAGLILAAGGSVEDKSTVPVKATKDTANDSQRVKTGWKR